MTPPEAFDEAALRAALSATPLGHPLFFLAHLPSTHSHALARACDDAPHGSLVVAREQSQGRGRQGRRWQHDATGGLALSWILRPQISARRAGDLVHVTALAVHDVLVGLGVPAAIKWPNDLVVTKKAGTLKLAGLLVESAARGAELDFAVISVGLNVNTTIETFAPELGHQASSVAIESGQQQDRAAVTAQLCQSLQRRLEQCRAQGLHALLPELRQHSCSLGKRIRLRQGQTWLKAVDLDPRGALIAEDPYGNKTICLDPPLEVSLRSF